MINDMSDSKWAVMLCINEKTDDWIFVTEKTDGDNMWDLQPVLFENINDALDFSSTWTIPGKEKNVQVVSYNES